MSNNIDTKTMQQNAMDITSQRKERISENKQQEIEEDNKDKQIMFEALDRIRERGITNTSEFTWEIMYYENKYKNNKKKKTNKNKKNLIKNNKKINNKK
eukprot:786023_1